LEGYSQTIIRTTELPFGNQGIEIMGKTSSSRKFYIGIS